MPSTKWRNSSNASTNKLNKLMIFAVWALIGAWFSMFLADGISVSVVSWYLMAMENTKVSLIT